MKVFKYSLELNSRYQRFLMPKGAQILTAQRQGTDPCIWALVDEKAPQDFRMFRIYPTGYVLDELVGETYKYLGTIQYEGGSLIYHLFEVVPVVQTAEDQKAEAQIP